MLEKSWRKLSSAVEYRWNNELLFLVVGFGALWVSSGVVFVSHYIYLGQIRQSYTSYSASGCSQAGRVFDG